MGETTRDNEPRCEHRGCEKKAAALIRTKQVRQGPGAGVETTVTWDITDAGPFLRKQGTQVCTEHRDHLLAELGKIL